ncbi:uncharacterized protein LOC111267914 isoform X2 [Varroa jacobsoni]|uniref:uncharacterized protein LOC111267914 isoform X2 n=1 Tax=Varroa jacobsoni TaxID=62625 RepID=UPI000BFA7679|nr:uncharacterized protein LOC111267914 isoform X2 [Varroa jacobsoni]
MPGRHEFLAVSLAHVLYERKRAPAIIANFDYPSSDDEANLRRALPAMFQNITFAQMALPIRPMFSSNPSQEDTEQEGRLLLRDFVSQEIERNHVVIESPENEEEEVFGAELQNNYNNGKGSSTDNWFAANELSRTAPSYSSNEPFSCPSSHLDSTFMSTQPRNKYSQGRPHRIVDPARLVYSHLSGPTSEPIPSPEEVLRSHPMYRDAGRQLSRLADEFARSRERQRVKQQAEALSMNTVTRENLIALMTELFHDGFSRERLVTLFFFCSDLIIKAMRDTQEGGGIRWEILGWVWEFFCDRVCAWVREHGGWENVLLNFLPKAIMDSFPRRRASPY